MAARERIVAVIGGGQCSKEEARFAEEVGRQLAKSGAILVCGGLGGVMEAACRGAGEEGGRAERSPPPEALPGARRSEGRQAGPRGKAPRRRHRDRTRLRDHRTLRRGG